MLIFCHRVLEHSAAFVTPIEKSTAPLSSLKDWSCIRVASWLRYGYCFGIQDERPAIINSNVSFAVSPTEMDLDVLESEVELRGGRCRCPDCEIKRSSSEQGVVLILCSRMSGEKIVRLLISVAADAQQAGTNASSTDVIVGSTTIFADTASQKLSIALAQDGKALWGRITTTEDITEATDNDEDVDRQTLIDTASALLCLGSKLSLLPLPLFLPLVTPPEEAKQEAKQADEEKYRKRDRVAALQEKKRAQTQTAVVHRLVEHHQAQQALQQMQQKLEVKEESSQGEEDDDDTCRQEGGDESGGEGEEKEREIVVQAAEDSITDKPSKSETQQPQSPHRQPLQGKETQKLQNLLGESSSRPVQQQQQQQERRRQQQKQPPQSQPQPQHQEQLKPSSTSIERLPKQPPRKYSPPNSQQYARQIMHRLQHRGDEEADESMSTSQDSAPIPERSGRDNDLLLQEIRTLSDEIRNIKAHTSRSDQLLSSQNDVQRYMAERDQAILELKKVSHASSFVIHQIQSSVDSFRYLQFLFSIIECFLFKFYIHTCRCRRCSKSSSNNNNIQVLCRSQTARSRCLKVVTKRLVALKETAMIARVMPKHH